MGFSTSGGNSRPSQIGSIVWGSKNTELPTPNIAFYDSNTKTTSYLVSPGSKANARVIGSIRKISVSAKEGFADREQKSGKKSEWHMYVTLETSPEEPLAVLGFSFVDELLNNADSRSLDLINHLSSLMEMMKSGQLERETPVEIGFYRKEKDGNSYPNSIIRLPSGYEDNQPVFADPKNFVKSEEMAPRGEKVLVDGKELKMNGVTVRDYTKVMEWADQKVTALLDYFGAPAEGQEHAPDGQAENGADDQAELADAAAAAADRPRMSA